MNLFQQSIPNLTMEGNGSLEIDEGNGELKISFRWLSFANYFIFAFALIVNSMVLYGVFNIPLADDSRWVLWIIYFPFLLFLYYSVANVFNKTSITVSKKSLKVRIHPLPWLGNKTIDVLEMSQFYVKRVASSSRSAGKTTSTISYQLHVVLTNGKHTKVIDGLAIPDVETAKVVEQKIESYLGIENRKVQGEFDGNSNNVR